MTRPDPLTEREADNAEAERTRDWLGLVETTTGYSWTVAALYQYVGEETLSRWQALGQADSDIHWAYGREAGALIEKGIPAMLVYLAIARKAGKSSQTIRKSYYTYKTFTDAQREEFHNAPYTVFQHARTCDDPDAVLRYYADEQGCTVDEIEAVFKQGEDEEFKNEFKQSNFPAYLVGAYRRLVGLSKPKRSKAEQLLREFIEVVK